MLHEKKPPAQTVAFKRLWIFHAVRIQSLASWDLAISIKNKTPGFFSANMTKLSTFFTVLNAGSS